MSIDQIAYVLEYERELKRKQYILNKLDLAECINRAYCASQPVDNDRSHLTSYEKWRQGLWEEIYPETKKVTNTIWDRFTGSFKID